MLDVLGAIATVVVGRAAQLHAFSRRPPFKQSLSFVGHRLQGKQLGRRLPVASRILPRKECEGACSCAVSQQSANILQRVRAWGSREQLEKHHSVHFSSYQSFAFY